MADSARFRTDSNTRAILAGLRHNLRDSVPFSFFLKTRPFPYIAPGMPREIFKIE